MSFLRHVGKHGDRKVAVIFREVPGESHMCLVTYTETLNMHIHDPLIKCIESDIGQNSQNLADALHRTYTKDGKPILQTLHLEGQLKKVQTAQIVMTPQPNTQIRLDELNKILDEMQQGEEAVKRLAEMDKSMGMQTKSEVIRKMRGPQNPPVQPSGDVLGDQQLAKQRLDQAIKMESEAQGLMTEAKRLKAEARSLDPNVSPTGEASIVVETPAPKVKKPRATKVVA
jgi:hypothetical protein